jgi:peptidyl-prolyl cis-trans isomerase C
MKKHVLISVLAVGTLATLAACHRSGQADNTPKPPVATINGKTISGDAFDLWVKVTTNKKSDDLTPEERKRALEDLEALVVTSQEGDKQAIASTPEIAARLELDRANILANAVFEKYLKSKPVTDDDLKGEYDRQIAKLPKMEYKASHILVKDEATAKDIIAKLEKKANFADLAKQSIDPGSAQHGGDLGYFTLDKMVPAFSAAVSKLEKGQFTHEPVQTQFGWHIIRLEDTRPTTPPPFEQVKDRLSPMLQQQMIHDYVETLKKSSKIEEMPVANKEAPKADAAKEGSKDTPKAESAQPEAKKAN